MADPVADIRATADATGDHGGESSAAKAHPVAVKGGAAMSVAVVLLALLVASVAVFLASSQQHAGGKPVEKAGPGEGCKQRAGEPVEHAVGDGVGIPPGFNSRLDAFRTWARLAWMKLRQPRSDEPRYDDGAAGSAGSVAGAAKKSFQMGKETVEQAAATAAKATGETVEKAKEKATRAAATADDEEEL